MHQPLDKKPTRSNKVIRRFNWLLLARSAAIVSVIGTAAYFLHRHQVRRAAGHFLVHAEVLKQQQKWRQAADYLFRYVQLQPADAYGRLELAKVYYRTATSIEQLQRASEFYAAAIGQNPSQVELHRDLAEIQLKIGNPAGAADRAGIGLNVAPGDPGCQKIVAQAYIRRARNTERLPAVEIKRAIVAALIGNPHDVDFALEAANCYREILREDPEKQRKSDSKAEPDSKAANLGEPWGYVEAAKVMDQLIAKHGGNADARLARYEFRRKFKLADADADLDEALALSPDNFEAQFLVGRREFERQAFQKAEACFRRAIEISGDDHRGHLGLARSLLAQGRQKDAVDALNVGLRHVNSLDIALRAEWVALLIALDRLNDAEQILRGLEGAIDTIVPVLNPAERLEARNAARLLRSRWLIASQNHAGAVQVLKALTASPAGPGQNDANQHLQAYMMLGECYAALNQWDLAAGAWEQSVKLQPLSAALRTQYGEALERAGRFEPALREFEQALRLPDAPSTTSASLLRCRMQLELRRPEAERNWRLVETDLAQLPRNSSNGVNLAILQAQYAAVQGRKDDAVAILKRVEAETADSVEIWPVLAIAFERWGFTSDAERAWRSYRRRVGATLEELTLRCELLCRRKEYAAARDYVAERLKQSSGDERRKTQLFAALLELRIGQKQQGLKQLIDAAAELSGDLRAWELVGEISMEQLDFATTQRAERELLRIEGTDGCLWRELACRRVLCDVRNRTPEALGFVTARLAEIEAQRPYWSRTYIIKGMLAELQGNGKNALEAYERAVALGDARPEVYQRLIPLLFDADRLTDANRYIAMMTNNNVVDARTTTASIAAHLRGGMEEQAVEIASAAVKRTPNDAAPRIWLAQTLLLAGRHAEAEKEFLQAEALVAHDPRPLIGLFNVYVQAKNREAAEKVLARIRAQAGWKPEQREFLAAQCYELLGDDVQARTHYLAARKLAPDNLTIQHACGMFFMSRSPGDAETALRRVLDLSPASSSARRALASILAARGGERAWQEAWSLLNTGDPELRSTADHRLMALLLVYRGTPENLEAATAIMEKIVRSASEPAPGDRLLLAKLYEGAGNIAGASKELLLVTSAADCDPASLANHGDFLLRQKKWAEAEAVIKRFESRRPDDFTSVALRARWFQGVGRHEEIVSLIDGHTQRAAARTSTSTLKAQAALEAANLYASMELRDDAERQYRSVLEFAPREYRYLVKFLVLTDRTSEAVKLCIEAAKSHDPIGAASLLCSTLARGRATSQDHELAEPVIAQAAASNETDTTLLFSLATLRYYQQRHEEARELFLKLLEINTEHVGALNNLASLLAEMPNRESEAIRYANQAIAAQGPHADLLDTLGVAQLKTGSVGEAVQTLTQACKSRAADPRYFLHLAMANERNGNAAAAAQALNKAKSMKLADQPLTSAERSALTQLESRLPAAKGSKS